MTGLDSIARRYLPVSSLRGSPGALIGLPARLLLLQPVSQVCTFPAPATNWVVT